METIRLLKSYKSTFGGRWKVFINPDKKEAKVVLHVGGAEITSIAHQREYRAIEEQATKLDLDLEILFETKLLRRAYGRYILLLISRVDLNKIRSEISEEGYEIYYGSEVLIKSRCLRGESKEESLSANQDRADNYIIQMVNYPSDEQASALHRIFKQA